jgi:hypothetical protein
MMEGSPSGRPKNFRIRIFVTTYNCKFDQFLVIRTLDPDPIRICIHLKRWIRIRFETNAEPQHCFIYIAIYRTSFFVLYIIGFLWLSSLLT